MRKNENQLGKIMTVVVIIVVIIVLVLKNFVKSDSNEDYLNYVKKFESSINKYAENNINNGDKFIYTYDELKNQLISNGLLDEYNDSGVKVSGESVTLSKENDVISFYNYNNPTTFENRFELSFIKDGKTIVCTKNECSK